MAKSAEPIVQISSQKSAEHLTQAGLSMPKHFSFGTELATDMELLENASTPVVGVKRKRSQLLIGQLVDEHSLDLASDLLLLLY